MKAIQTKYLPPTANKGARIKAWAEGVGSLVVPYPHEFDGAYAHRVVAEAFRDRLRWAGRLAGGSLPGGGYAFVFVD